MSISWLREFLLFLFCPDRLLLLLEISSTQDAGTLLYSFFVEAVRPSDGASVLAATEKAQEFFLEYAQNHLKDTDNVTITTGKFGECSSLIKPMNWGGGGVEISGKFVRRKRTN